MVAISKEIFSQGVPFRWILPLLLLSIPETLSMVLPMAAVLGGLLGTQQMMEGSELVAAQGLGAGRKTWTTPWLIMAAVLLVLSALNAHLLVPAAAQGQQVVKRSMTEAAKSKFLRPGAAPWHPPDSPDSAFWVSESGQLHIMESNPQGAQHTTASHMTYSIGNAPTGGTEILLHLTDLRGALFQASGTGSVILLKQENQTLRFPIPTSPHLLPPTPLRYESSMGLLRILRRNSGSTRIFLQAAIELCRRTTLPLATASLLLLGIALGFGHPRFYQGGAIAKSLGVILLYYLFMKYFENIWLSGKLKTIYPMILLPLACLVAGWFLLSRRLAPHRSSGIIKNFVWSLLTKRLPLATLHGRLVYVRDLFLRWVHGKGTRHGIFRHWATLGWWRNWVLTLGSLLALDLLIEFSSLAGDLSQNHIQYAVFIEYWLWSLPPFLEVAFPMAFLLGSMMTLSEAALNREWLAIRAAGVSLVQWIWASRLAWGSIALLTFWIQVGIAPRARENARVLYRKILNRPMAASTTHPWMYLGSTGVLWHLSPEVRWGFPLKPPGEAPILLRWQPGAKQSEALAWGGLALVQGLEIDRLFPDRSLQKAPSIEEARTIDLIKWQRWAPDPEQSYLLWNRLLGWLAGPLLILAMLSYAFPGPRQGRGQAIGSGLVAGLVFLGLQNLFGGAAKAAEIPPPWGVVAPLLLLLCVSLLRVYRLRT
jgi:lipopolysaccharide export LptBFGC system permease protein LptF